MLGPDEIAALLPAVARGEREAFERFYEATRAKVYGVVLRILRRHDLAIGVMEDTYQQVWSTAGQFDAAHISAVAWVVAVARARAIDLARLPATAEGEGEPEIADSVAPSAVSRRQMTDDLKRLLTCIGRLEPERQRMVLLAYFGALTRDQLAIKLDMPTNLLTSALRRSLFEIEQCLTF
jgi:RNA polymerase sigma-70 factor, ECF subfamily